MKFNLTRTIPGVALICLALASCKKNDAVSPSTQLSSQLTNTTNVIALGEDELNAEIDELTSDDAGTESISSGSFDCKLVSVTPSKKVYPHVKTTDFGSGCSDEGKTISGKRLTTVHADWKTAAPGTLISTITFNNYTVNGLSVGGNIKKTFMSDGNFKIVTTKTFKDNTGNSSTFRGTHYQKQIEGNSTATREDDVYEITGISNGAERTGDNTIAVWKATIDENNVVIKAANCMFRSKGGLKIQIRQTGSTDKEYLDYGNGTCDNIATLSVNGGDPVDITLPLVFYTAHL